MKRCSIAGLFVLAVVCGSAAVRAEDSTRVYRHVAPDGVVTFSDKPSAGAEAIELPADTPRPEDVARAGEMYQQQLQMIEVLRQSRQDQEAEAARQRELDFALARAEAARAAAEASAAMQPQESYVYAPWYAPGYPPYGPGYGWPGHGRPGYGGPGHGHPGRPGDGHGRGAGDGPPPPQQPPRTGAKLH